MRGGDLLTRDDVIIRDSVEIIFGDESAFTEELTGDEVTALFG